MSHACYVKLNSIFTCTQNIYVNFISKWMDNDYYEWVSILLLKTYMYILSASERTMIMSEQQ